MATSDQTGQHIDKGIHRTAMPSMLDLRDIFELINDRLDDGPLGQQDLIVHQHQPVLKVLGQFGDQLQVVH